MGTTAVDTRIYAVWDLVGVLAWANFWLLGGAAAERQLHMLLDLVKARGGTVIDILLGAALVYLLYRMQQRRRERRRFARAASAEASAEASQDAPRGWRRIVPPKVLDARPQALALDAQRTIPGALALDPHSTEQIDVALRAYDMVIYCICPDSATAVEITQRMRLGGYTRIRALRGGLEAWQRRGFPVEPLRPPDESTTGKRPPQPPGDEASGTRGNFRGIQDIHDESRGAITLRGFAPRRSQNT